MNGKHSSTDSQNTRKSIIISALDRFADKVYGLLCTGFFGRAFTSYSSSSGKIINKAFRGSRLRNKLDSGRRAVARSIESSIIFELYSAFIRYFASMRVKVYGTGLVTFFLYSACVSLYGYFAVGGTGIPMGFICYVLFAFASVPLLFSGIGICKMLSASGIGRKILRITGNRMEDFEKNQPCGRCNVAFLVGTVLGLSTFFIPVKVYAVVIAAALWVMAVLHSPEFGIVSLFFFLPFDGTVIMALKVCVVLASFLIKFILGKRTVKFESTDIIAFLFAAMILVGGLFSVSEKSYKPMLVYLCFMSVYFITVSLMRSGEWLNRCVISAVCAGTVVALYGIFQYLTGSVGVSSQWLDMEMFGGITGRVISTFDNPNVLGEYLIMLLPMTALIFLCRFSDLKRKLSAFAVFLIMCACLVFTWSRGAWLGFFAGFAVFLLIWNKRVLHTLWMILLTVPFLPSVLPDNIVSRLSSIGNLADSSTAYRFKIWLGAIKMLPDRIFSGIGIGSDAWSAVYPSYALNGMDEALHSHSLYFQIWIELGAAALVIFIVFLVSFFRSNFTMYRSVSEAGDSLISRIYTAPVKDYGDFVKTGSESSEIKNLRRIRSAIRMNAASPMCGIIAVLVQGTTDNIWYNYRIFLMFWLCLGLSAAYASFGRERIASGEMLLYREDSSEAVADISIIRNSGYKTK